MGKSQKGGSPNDNLIRMIVIQPTVKVMKEVLNLTSLTKFDQGGHFAAAEVGILQLCLRINANDVR